MADWGRLRDELAALQAQARPLVRAEVTVSVQEMARLVEQGNNMAGSLIETAAERDQLRERVRAVLAYIKTIECPNCDHAVSFHDNRLGTCDANVNNALGPCGCDWSSSIAEDIRDLLKPAPGGSPQPGTDVSVDAAFEERSDTKPSRDVSWLSDTHWKLLGVSAHLAGWAALRPEEKALQGTRVRVSPGDCDRIVDAAVAKVREQIRKWAEPDEPAERSDAV